MSVRKLVGLVMCTLAIFRFIMVNNQYAVFYSVKSITGLAEVSLEMALDNEYLNRINMAPGDCVLFITTPFTE